jgi:hypothetical protein
MNSHGSAERSEDYPWETANRLLPRSGRPIAHPNPQRPPRNTRPHYIEHFGLPPRGRIVDHDTMGCTRYARFTHGFSRRTLRVQCNYTRLCIAAIPHLN